MYTTFIGRAISLALAQKGLFVTVLDFSEESGKDTVLLIEKENAKFHQNLRIPASMYIKCDVTNASKYSDVAAAVFVYVFSLNLEGIP